MTLDELSDEMIDFGVSRDTVLRMAPALLPYFDDQGRLLEAKLAHDCPKIGERAGLVRIH